MRKQLLSLIFLALTACSEPSRTLTKLPDDAVILAFGDSLTYGTGASRLSDYPNVLSELTSLEVINEGIPGEISEEGLERLPALLDEYQPKLLILIHGGNDLLRKIPSEQIAANLNKMIEEAAGRHIEVVMLGVPQPNLLILTSADFYQRIAKDRNVLVDLNTLPDILGDNSLKSDMIHPNDAGYQLMAGNIFKLLQEAGAL
ncbi:MAG: GDSL-type esterase/lipase family protein [Methylobacter sp.]|uniref:GDSL-type esterase/lipase family protein n=1 Tax=Methylobacter sp. TaxID=2051955 RepID=UPI00258DE4FC|nr:GDSL-type esterase/lipase family protein [Methylobacter sp.]MCL7420719.1 GDSL-type esterase/lipase family protein [Methylobacter sp.]